MNRVHAVLAAAATLLAFAALLADARPTIDVADFAADIASGRDHLSAIDLAERLVGGDRALRIVDVRSAAEYERFHIPGSTHLTLQDLARTRFSRSETIVLYSEGAAHAAQGWALLRLRGYRSVFFLREGIYEWVSRVHEPRLAVDATSAEREAFERGAALSRFFGGQPQADVPRSAVPAGYWTSDTTEARLSRAATAIDAIRRRGC